MMKQLIIIIFVLFSGCSNAPESGDATIIDKNIITNYVIQDTNQITVVAEKNETVIVKEKNTTIIQEEKNATLSYYGKSSVNVEEGATAKINFSLKNGNSKTEVISQSSSESNVFSKNPDCSSTGQCSVSLLALKSGDSKVVISLKDNPNEKFQVFIQVEKKEVELKKESLLFTQSSQTLIDDGIELEVNKSVNIDFIIKDFNSNTKIKETHNSQIIETDLDCDSSICQIKITGKSKGSNSVNVYVDKNVFINLKIPVEVLEIEEANISDEVNSSEENKTIIISDEANLTENNETLVFGLGEMSIDFASGQSSNLQIDEGSNIIITTIIQFPRKASETIAVLPTADKLVKIISTTLDSKLSDNKKIVFRTTINALSRGIERILFRVKDSNLSIALDVSIKQMTCGLSESTYDVLQSGVENSQIMLGTKFGFNSVAIIYPKISIDSKIDFQNFSYLSDNGKGGVIHSGNSQSAFAFVKFIKELEGESYQIKYRKDGDIELKCLNGLFPARDIVQTDEEINIEESTPPAQPE